MTQSENRTGAGVYPVVLDRLSPFSSVPMFLLPECSHPRATKKRKKIGRLWCRHPGTGEPALAAA